MKKTLLSTMLVCSLTLGAIAGPTLTLADTIDQKIEQQDQKINSLKGQQADAQTQISSLESEIATVSSKVSDLEAEQLKLSKETEKLQDKIATLKLRIAKREEAIQKQARDTQVNGKSTNFIDAVLDADSLSDVIGRVQAMTTIVNANNDLVQQQKRDQKLVEDNIKENESKISTVLANQEKLETQKNALASKQAELNVLKASLAAEQATAEKDKAKLTQEKKKAEAEQARIRKEQEEAAGKAEAARQEEAKKQAAAAKEQAQASTSTESSSTAQVTESTTESSVEKPSNSTVSNNTNTGTGNTNTNNGGGNNNSSAGTGSGIDHSNSGNMYAVGQCTWYVKNVAPWVGTYWGNGGQWGASAAADGYLVNSTPAAGSVVVFAPGQQIGDWTADGSYGHVAYVQSYNAANNTITITQGGMGFSSPTGPNAQTLSASGLVYIHR